MLVANILSNPHENDCNDPYNCTQKVEELSSQQGDDRPDGLCKRRRVTVRKPSQARTCGRLIDYPGTNV